LYTFALLFRITIGEFTTHAAFLGIAFKLNI